MALRDWFDRFAVWEGFHPDLETLLIYGAGIALYTALVFAFYQNISRRDPLHTKSRKGWWGRTVHVAETALTFPVLSFGYFAVLALAIFVLAKPDRSTADILLLSMACVMGVRFTAHWSETTANDVAKLLPLGLLAVVVVDPGHLENVFATAWRRMGEALMMTPVLLQYFALFIVVEAVLRAVRALFPGLARLAHRVEHRRRLSKRAMLRDIEGEHEHGFHLRRAGPLEHGPRDRSRDFLMLDENAGGKPGSGQGVGPAIRRELQVAKAARAPAHAHRASAPKAGPGGKGGKLTTW
ncbi:MAG TPA: hypothetical protein VFH78_14285 [Candidatus Thermoplasmatota archaeon]|nr:hypothetical protein [Candidatus Thermoplasmatota archaeon]